MPASTAQKYFGVKIEASQTVQLILGENVQNLETKRTYKEAKELYEQIKESLGEKAARTRYAMEAINKIASDNELNAQHNEIKGALRLISNEEKDEFKQETSSEKTGWLNIRLTTKIAANRPAKENAQIQPEQEEQQDAA